MTDLTPPHTPSEPPDRLTRLETAFFGAILRFLHRIRLLTTTTPPLFPHDPPATPRDRRVFYKLALLIILLDQVSKWLIEAKMPLNSQWAVIPSLFPYFQFTHVANFGTAFGLFPDASVLFALIAAAVALGIAVFNYEMATRSRSLRLALGLIMGGALGNLIDRLRLGYVTDFIDLDLSPILKTRLADWAIFNVADMCVVGGAIFLAFLLITSPAPEIEKGENSAESPSPAA